MSEKMDEKIYEELKEQNRLLRKQTLHLQNQPQEIGRSR